MPYYKVYWVATVGESVVKAENEEEAKRIAHFGSDAGDKIISEDFWWHDAQPCADEAEELTPEEMKLYDIQG